MALARLDPLDPPQSHRLSRLSCVGSRFGPAYFHALYSFPRVSPTLEMEATLNPPLSPLLTCVGLVLVLGRLCYDSTEKCYDKAYSDFVSLTHFYRISHSSALVASIW